MTEGICSLTGKHGTFVKSHIIPRAFTDHSLDKTSRIEFGQFGRRPILRHTSWYDSRLVTKDGEAKLAKLDALAAEQFQKFGLCWRFFPISSDVKKERITETEFELIEVNGADTKGLRLFFLSLLWRAVSSKRQEFREIRLDINSKRKLTRIVNGEIKPHPSDLPIALLLLTTKGQPQVLSPLRQRMAIPQLVEGLPREVKIHRFFLDGMIAHIGRKSMDLKLLESWSPRAVGVGDTLTIIGLPLEGSFQAENLSFLESELAREWSGEAARIFGAL